MSLPRLLIVMAIALFGGIALASWLKQKPSSPATPQAPVEVLLESPSAMSSLPSAETKEKPTEVSASRLPPNPRSAEGLPDADLIQRLFDPNSAQLPFVETVTYSSRVPWLTDRPAWLADYAAHYATSRHFIARSLNRKADYFTQNVSNGNRFNVLRYGREISFYLLVDLSRCKMWFYCVDHDTHLRYLLKRYDVGLGRLEPTHASGSLTPLGKYALGDKVAIYRPSVTGLYQGQKIEMIRVFGTRWIPFERALDHGTEPAKGLGLHGAPWQDDPATQGCKEVTSSIGHYESDGCIRLATPDMEELFAIIITKPTTIEIVRDFADAQLPGKEVFPEPFPL